MFQYFELQPPVTFACAAVSKIVTMAGILQHQHTCSFWQLHVYEVYQLWHEDEDTRQNIEEDTAGFVRRRNCYNKKEYVWGREGKKKEDERKTITFKDTPVMIVKKKKISTKQNVTPGRLTWKNRSFPPRRRRGQRCQASYLNGR